MSGAAGIRYYLPTNFTAAGTSEDIALLASGIDGTVQVGCTIGAMFFIDRIGRRHSLGVGAIIMAFCLMVSILFPHLSPRCILSEGTVD
jgi:predicted MFS family arabinose efflux permease